MSYIHLLLGLLILVVVAIIILKRRARPASTTAPPSGDKREPRPTTTINGEKDEDATMVYFRSSQVPPVESINRSGVASTPANGARLLCLSGPDKGTNYPVGANGLTVGRNPACDIVIDDPRVSGKHAWVGIVGDKVVLRDLNSTNGTFLNAQSHSSVGEAELRGDDTIFFGGHKGNQFRFVTD